MKGSYIFTILFLALGGAGCRHTTSEKAGKADASKDTSISAGEKRNAATEWIPDVKASSIQFAIKNFGADVHGSLGSLEAKIYFDEKDLDHSSFEASVKVNTINTGINRRDKDLMREKYLDESANPNIIFRTGKIVKSGNEYLAKGTLTIKGNQQIQEWPFTFEKNGDKGVFRSTFTLDRLEYGIGGNGPVMGKQVHVSLEVPVNKSN